MTRLAKTSTVVLQLLLLAACSNPASDRPRAVTNQAAPVASGPVTGEKYLITPENSKIQFIGSKVTGSHNGSFGKFSGTIDYAGQPEKSRVSITIEAASLQADDPKLTEHLKTADFFDVAKYPQATFESTEIKAGGDKGASHTVTGNLNLHGVTKSITFPATITTSPTQITVESNFSINRKDFGINYAGASDNLIRDDVVLTLHVRAVKS
ncbi:MAG TPA: YceI family protein [Pyrinomonadaceae bacterium]|nr:YceI family protein [Pyrinomonadaceae bacterium]